MKANVTTAFWSGALVSVACHSFYQDAMGPERYIAHARNYWVDAVYTVPLAIVFLLLGCGGYIAAKLAERE